jgi:dUTP pyrophosphatase
LFLNKKIKNDNKHHQQIKHPCHYETIASAGMDLRANISEPITLKSLERTIVKQAVLRVAYWYEAQVRPRSGLAAKMELQCSILRELLMPIMVK